MASSPYEPSPRAFSFSSVIDNKFILYGGKNTTNLSVDSYDNLTELWSPLITTGSHPPKLSGGSGVSHEESFFMFGGMVGSSLHNSLYQLDLKNMTFSQVTSNEVDSPMKKRGCGMITYDQSMIIYGGECGPSYPIQQGSELVQNGNRYYTNDLHSFNIKEGM